MPDRDRLAADLHDVLKWAGMGDFNVVADIVADRLIALGWTRHPLGTEDAIAQYQRMLAASEASADREITRLRALVGSLDEERPSVLRKELDGLDAIEVIDEERLDDVRRAITRSGDDVICHHASLAEHDAAIAKAYREDTDATD